MDINEKIALLESINSTQVLPYEFVYDVLEKCAAIKNDYTSYMITAPIDCNKELLRLPTAGYDLCCALITMLLREDYFSNGSFEIRQRAGQVKDIIERMVNILLQMNSRIKCFSEKSIAALNGYYVYALVDPRSNEVFYVGKGIENRVFAHEYESKNLRIEKEKHQRIKDIEAEGFFVKRLIVNWGLSEAEAFASEATLINMMNYISGDKLTNIVAGHHVHEGLTAEEFELMYGAPLLEATDIKHNILVIKINKLYRKNMSDADLYDVVRGFWKASLNSIKIKKIQYVFGVYNGLIVAVYKPDEWHYAYEMIDIPQKEILTLDDIERLKNRVYFICKDYNNLDEAGQFYLHKSINNLKNTQSAQNPITYLSPIVVAVDE